MPLIVETLLLCGLAFFIGLALAALIFRPRPARGSYLDE